MECRKTEIFDVEAARLVNAGRVPPDPSWSMATHVHDYWEFIYFLRGRGRVDTPDGTLRPQEHYLVVYPPGLPHAEVADPVAPEETIFFAVDVPGAPPSGAHLILPDNSSDLRWLCERILAEYILAGGSPLAITLTRAFLYLVGRAWETGVPVEHDMVDLAVQYLHANSARPLTLQTVARAVGVSETHLSHRFAARMGVPPMRYLQGLRADAAKRLLTTTGLPIQQVAEQCGFADPLYLSRVIRRVTGLSPSAYRRAAARRM